MTKTKGHTFDLEIPSGLAERFAPVAKRKGLTLAELLDRALRKYLEEKRLKRFLRDYLEHEAPHFLAKTPEGLVQ